MNLISLCGREVRGEGKQPLIHDRDMELLFPLMKRGSEQRTETGRINKRSLCIRLK